MLHPSSIITVLLCASFLTACTEPDGSPGRGLMNGGALNKQEAGVALGVVSGSVLGSMIGSGTGQVAAIIGGGLLGGVLGGSVGSSMDNADRAAYDRATQRSMETGSYGTWKNGANRGSIQPRKYYRNDDGMLCREYTQTIYIGKEKHKGRGTACKQADGTWVIVE